MQLAEVSPIIGF